MPSELVNLALRDPELSGLPTWEHRAHLDKTVSYLERFADEARLERPSTRGSSPR